MLNNKNQVELRVFNNGLNCCYTVMPTAVTLLLPFRLYVTNPFKKQLVGGSPLKKQKQNDDDDGNRAVTGPMDHPKGA